MTAATRLEEIESRHPEWRPWLGVVAHVLPEAARPVRDTRWRFFRTVAGDPMTDTAWDALVPEPPAVAAPGVPMLAAALLPPPARVLPLLNALIRSATDSAGIASAGLPVAACSEADARRVFEDAVNGDEPALAAIAAGSGVEVAAFGAVAALLPMPFLRACARRLAAARPVGWQQGYCPCCAAWPALAETCGIERSRYLRCGRCGSAWQMPLLTCVHCATDNHELLASLVPEGNSAGSAIEVCNHCRGYLKTFTRLRPGPPEQVLLDDLASVELDIAATSRDYRRPPGLGYPLGFQAGS